MIRKLLEHLGGTRNEMQRKGKKKTTPLIFMNRLIKSSCGRRTKNACKNGGGKKGLTMGVTTRSVLRCGNTKQRKRKGTKKKQSMFPDF